MSDQVTLNWQENKSVNPFEAAVGNRTEYIVLYSEFDERSDNKIRAAIEECIGKAVSLLEQNIRDDSMFLLFERDAVYSLLTIVVTDESKEKDSSYVVKCCMSELDKEMNTISEKSEKR